MWSETVLGYLHCVWLLHMFHLWKKKQTFQLNSKGNPKVWCLTKGTWSTEKNFDFQMFQMQIYITVVLLLYSGAVSGGLEKVLRLAEIIADIYQHFPHSCIFIINPEAQQQGEDWFYSYWRTLCVCIEQKCVERKLEWKFFLWCVFTFVLVKCALKEIVHRLLRFFHFVLTGNTYEIPHLTQNFIHYYIIFVDWKAISLRHFLFNNFGQKGLVFCRGVFFLSVLVRWFGILNCLFKRFQIVLYFTASILASRIWKLYAREKLNFSNKTYTSATRFTRISAWNHLGFWPDFFGFNRPLTFWDVAKEVGSFSVCAAD